MANQTIYPYGQDGELPSNIGIVNDLITGGADKALAAEQGKVLNEKIIKGDSKEVSVNLYGYTQYSYIIGDDNKWIQQTGSSNGKAKCVLIGLDGVNIVSFLANGGQLTYAFLKTNTMSNNTAPDFSDSYTSRIRISDGESAEYFVPSDANYLYIATAGSSGNDIRDRYNITFYKEITIINDIYTGGVDVPWSAEQGKIINEQIRNFIPRDLAAHSQKKAFIRNDNGNWAVTNNYYCIFVAVMPNTDYIIKANADRYSYIAVLSDNSYADGSTPNYADGCSLIRMNAGELMEVHIPSNGSCLYVGKTNNGNDCLPQFVKIVEEKTSALETEIEEVNSRRINTDTLTRIKGWLISSYNQWENVSISYTNDYAYVLVPITAGKKYICSTDSESAYFAVLSSDSKTDGGTPSFCTGFETRIWVWKDMPFIFTAPEDAVYLYVAMRSSGNEKLNYVAESIPISELIAGIDNGSESVRDKFETAPDYYTWKKAEQMLNLKWTPLKAVPKSTSGNFAANTEQTGTPYSSVAEYDKRIGHDVSFHTFMTALHNPYSLLYTENVRHSSTQSAYGITYWGPENSAMYYGVVCSGYTGYALGMQPYVTSQFLTDLIDRGIVEEVYDQSANGVKQGDILAQDGHGLLVHEVWRKNGEVTNVLVTEQWQPLARTRGLYTAEQFNSFISTEGITILRPKELYKNINYEQSPFVTVGDETPMSFTYNDDICTFAGDKASFHEGDLIYIHCLNLDYPQMEIYKNNSLLETITLSSDSRASLTSDNLAYAVNLSNDNLTYGKYKCRLKNGDTYSDYTYFEIINATVTVSGDIATYSSANAVAVLWYWQKYQNTGGGIHAMTELPGLSSGTIDVSDRSTNPLLKVLFKGEYGRVSAKFLEER